MSNIEPNDANVDFSGLLASINPEISRVLKSAIEGKDTVSYTHLTLPTNREV